MDDFVLNVRQILQYPRQSSVQSGDALLLQRGGLGGPYISAYASDFLATALNLGGWINFAPGKGGVAWNGAQLTWKDGVFHFNEPVAAPIFSAAAMFINGEPVATIPWVTAHEVTSFNFRTGDVLLELKDIMQAGGAPILNPHLLGWCTATSPIDPTLADDTIATTKWVQEQWCAAYNTAACLGSLVTRFDGRGGDVWLNDDDITFACTQPGAQAKSNTPPSGDASKRIATTAFVDDGLTELKAYLDAELDAWTKDLISQALANYAPINSPQFTGVPTAPTANAGTSTGQLATCAFVQAATAASVAGVASFNTRTGAVVLTTADLTSVGGALIAGPTFTGVPKAPTAAPADNTTQLATTAFVHAAVAAVNTGVVSFNSRTGAVVLSAADVSSTGILNNTALTGVPTGPTAAPGVSTSQLATTAYVAAAVITGGGVTSWNGRLGAVSLQASDVSAVGGAMINSPAFTGVPTAPTAAPGTNNTAIATTAFVTAALGGSTTVTTFNGRNGAVTLNSSDISGASGALLAGPSFTGVPTAPTATAGTNTAQIATTAFVTAAVSASGVTSFNGRIGVVTLSLADVTGVGGAPVASPGLTGTPTAPTAAPGTNTAQLATCAFANAAAAAGGVTSWNSRTGAVVLIAADVSAVGGAMLASPTFTGVPVAPTAGAGTSTGQLATTAFVAAAVAAAGGVVTVNGRSGAVVINSSDITGASGALLASPNFTGVPTAPTPVAGTNTAQIATTAFVEAAIAATGVTTFNGRNGAVTLTGADITGAGGALIASPTFTGTPSAPTATPATTNTTQIATCAFVQSALASSNVVSFNGRTGAVTLTTADITGAGGAVLASPAFTGTPTAPTATVGTSTGQLATTAFVQAAIAGGAGVVSFNSRAGVVVLQAADVTGVGGALIASPAFTGVPTAPTASPGTNNTALATTAFVAAAIASGTGHVISFNTRSGAVTLTLADITGVGGAPLASPAFTGVPTAPTASPGTNTTQLATTAFVAAQAAAAAGITAYFSGQINITTSPNCNSNDNVNHVLGFAAAHGFASVFCCSLTGTAPTGLTANWGYYGRSLTATTIALYPTLADAKADTNRVAWTGTGFAFGFRVWTYSGVFQSGFDPLVPIGNWGNHGATINLELNLATPLGGLFAVVIQSRLNNLAGTSAVSLVWLPGTNPTIVSTTLIRYDANNWTQNLSTQNPGTHSTQAQSAIFAEYVVIG
jgi:hypothetical protein